MRLIGVIAAILGASALGSRELLESTQGLSPSPVVAGIVMVAGLLAATVAGSKR